MKLLPLKTLTLLSQKGTFQFFLHGLILNILSSLEELHTRLLDIKLLGSVVAAVDILISYRYQQTQLDTQTIQNSNACPDGIFLKLCRNDGAHMKSSKTDFCETCFQTFLLHCFLAMGVQTGKNWRIQAIQIKQMGTWFYTLFETTIYKFKYLKKHCPKPFKN